MALPGAADGVVRSGSSIADSGTADRRGRRAGRAGAERNGRPGDGGAVLTAGRARDGGAASRAGGPPRPRGAQRGTAPRGVLRRWLTAGAALALLAGTCAAAQTALAPPASAASSPATAIATGLNDSCMINGGVAYCWGAGWGYGGFLGGATGTPSSVPVAVSTSGVLAGKAVTQISVGSRSACALDSTGTAYCWGVGGSGELGDGSTTSSSVPVAVSTSGVLKGKTLTQISAGNDFACALDSTGGAYCWGENDAGELGNGSTSSSLAPVAVSTSGVLKGKTLTQITAGDQYSVGDNTACALDSTGATYCWGDNGSGELGDGSTTSSSVPVAVSTSGVLAGKTVTQISAGDFSVCALDSTGAAYCWGDNRSGELGDGSTTTSSVPVAVSTSAVPAGNTLTQITAGEDDSVCALDNTGAAYCWGDNGSGELGNGSTTSSLAPVAVSTSGVLAGKTLIQISAGGQSACALDSTGAAYCWGGNGSGELGDNSTTSSSVPVPVFTFITVTVSAASVRAGTLVTFTAMTPAAATGSVTFTDLLSSGPQNGQNVLLGTVALSGGTAALTVSLPAFNTNTVTAIYGGNATYPPDTSPSAGVQVTAYTGEVLINQFRLSGPGGATDQYAELYNAGPAVSLAGFTLAASSGTSVTVPANAPVLATGHSYLIAGDGYSLSAAASPDLTAASLGTWPNDLGTSGLKLTAPDGPGTVTDAVGSAGASPGYYSGTPLPAMTGTPADQYAWVRLAQAGTRVNTTNNAADFQLVSTTGGVVGGVQSALGSPSPLASGSSVPSNGVLQSALLVSGESAGAAPNYVLVGTGSGRTLTIRRTITNSSGQTITSAELRITSLSEANGAPEPDVTTQPSKPAGLQIIDPATPTSQVTNTGGVVLTVQNLSVNPPATASPGGGLATTMSIPLGTGGLAPGASVSIALTFAVDHGGTYWFGYDVDATSVSNAPIRPTPATRGTPTGILPQPQPSATAKAQRYAGGHGVLP